MTHIGNAITVAKVILIIDSIDALFKRLLENELGADRITLLQECHVNLQGTLNFKYVQVYIQRMVHSGITLNTWNQQEATLLHKVSRSRGTSPILWQPFSSHL